jgi:hypothetical protein
MAPLSKSVRGKWDSKTSGGCPRNESWTDNPQYLLLPSNAEGGEFSVTLRCAAAPKLDIGFVVLRQDAKDRAGRKTTTKVRKAELVDKTKWRTTDQVSLNVNLSAPAPGKGFIVLPCTYEPGPQASFELQVVSTSGEEFTLIPIGDEPVAPAAPAPLAAATPAASNAAAGGGGEAAVAKAAAAANPTFLAPPISAVGGADYTPPDMGHTDTSAGPVAENEVEVKSEGQGLSQKQKRDAAELVAKALASAGESAGGLYSDPDFVPTPSSLWINGVAPGEALQAAGVAADLVQSWRRPSEFAPALAATEGEPRLFYSDWGTQGVVASPLLNHWLLAACNIVGGDVDILERVFVDTEHAKNGFCARHPRGVAPPRSPPPCAVAPFMATDAPAVRRCSPPPLAVDAHRRCCPPLLLTAVAPHRCRRSPPSPLTAAAAAAARRADVVRFYVDDPSSDDDWQVVLVDDLLPCGADGLPCFARCPSPVVLWISLIEKVLGLT